MSASDDGPNGQPVILNIVTIADGESSKGDNLNILIPKDNQSEAEITTVKQNNVVFSVAQSSVSSSTASSTGADSAKTQIPPGCEDHIGYIGDSNSLLTSKIVEELQQKLNKGKPTFRVVQVAEIPGSPGTPHKQIPIIPSITETKSEIDKASEADDSPNLSTTSCFWTRLSTLLLINLHTEHSALFSNSHYKKKTVWEMLARKMRDKGHDYTWNQLESKWKAMTKKFRDTIDHNEKHGHVIMHVCSYFDELAAVYKYKPSVVEKTLASRVSDSGVKLVMGGKSRASPKRSVPVDDSEADWVEDEVPEMPKKKKYVSTVGASGYTSTVGSSGYTSTVGSSGYTSTVGASGYSSSVGVSGYVGNSKEQSPEKLPELFWFVKNLHNDKKRQNMDNMEKIEAMHNEKMALFNSFLDIFKDFVQKH